MLMAHLQRAGHSPIAVVGGGTGMVGDPSGKTEARKLLTEEIIAYNLQCQRAQLERVLDLSAGRGRIIDNAEWLNELKLVPFLRDIGVCFSVNRMLSAEGYRQRLERGLSFIEFNYQILQAYDFLVLHERFGCRLQLGGDDQWGNILAGVDLVRRKHEAQVFALTLPLLVTATGQKMGKTHSGAVWLDGAQFSPFDFYQYWIGCDDRDVGRFLRLYTFLDRERIEALERLEGADVREAKAALAWEVTAMIHGASAADQAREAAKAMVAGAASEDLPTWIMPVDYAPAPWLVVNLLADAGLAKSRSEARRLVEGGGVRVDAAKVDAIDLALAESDLGTEGVVLRVGKARAVRVTRAM
jgi:tyrosyl-tRNA synthetase